MDIKILITKSIKMFCYFFFWRFMFVFSAVQYLLISPSRSKPKQMYLSVSSCLSGLFLSKTFCIACTRLYIKNLAIQNQYLTLCKNLTLSPWALVSPCPALTLNKVFLIIAQLGCSLVEPVINYPAVDCHTVTAAHNSY